MDGLRGHHAKGRKPNTEREIPYDFDYTWNLKNNKNPKTQKTKYQAHRENMLVLSEAGGFQGTGMGEMGERSQKFRESFRSLNKQAMGRNVLYSMATVVNNAVVRTGKLAGK